MSPVRRLKANLATQEGRTLRAGTEVAATDETTTGWHNVRLRVIVVADVRYHVREEDLAYACGEQ